MRLNNVEREELLSVFPKVELSYEAIVHKKVYNSQFVSIIPKGVRHFLWFTTHHSQNVCFFMELNDHNKIMRIKSHYYVCFDSELSYGTIIYGTLFVHNYTTYFSTQDVLYYKGTDLRRNNVSMVERYSILENMFHYHIKQVSYFKNNVVVGMSIIHTDFQTLIQSVKTIPYPVEYIQFRYTRPS